MMNTTKLPHPATIAPSAIPESDIAAHTCQDQIDWLGAQEDIIQLRVSLVHAPDYVYEPMTAFAREADVAVKQSDWERMKTAAKDIGKIGLNYLQEASTTTLAKLTAKALAA